MNLILKRREKIILYATIGVIIFAVAFNLFISPAMNKNEGLEKEIVFTRAKLKKYLQLINSKGAIEAKYNSLSSTFKLPSQESDNILTALSELDALAKNANIRILDIRPQEAGGTAYYKEILIDLRTEGEMSEYLKFIYNLDKSFSALSIKKFQLNSRTNSNLLEGIFTISQFSVAE